MPHRVYILAGQSNALGRDTTANLSAGNASYANSYPAVRYAATVDCPDDDGAQAGCDVELPEWIDLQVGIDPSEPLYFGPEVSLGRDLDAGDGNTIYLLKVADSGTTLVEDWAQNPVTGTFMWRRMNRFIGMATANIPGHYEYAGFVWVQGESDATVASGGAAVYQANLEEFIDEVRNLYGANLPFVIARLHENQKQSNGGQFQDAQVDLIQAAQDAVGTSRQHVTVYNPDALELGAGNLHYTADGTVDLGSGLAAALLTVIPDRRLVATTDFQTIRGAFETQIKSLVPSQHSGVKFEPARDEQRFEDWVEQNPRSMRRFTIDNTLDWEPPDVTGTDALEIRQTCTVKIAYPETMGTYGINNRRSMQDLIEEDIDQIDEAIGLHGYANYATGLHASTLVGTSVDDLGAAWVVSMTFEIQYLRDR